MARFMGAGALLVAVALGVFASSAIARPLIQGGTTAAEGQFPWMTWVKIGGPEVEEPSKEEWEQSCSGTVISPDLVLTAGHCVMEENNTAIPASRYTVVAGAVSRFSTSAARSRVTEAIPYPDFKFGCELVCGHDAALLVLSKTISVPSIRLATSTSDGALVVPDAHALEAGWGLTSPQGQEIPVDLQYVETELQDPVECEPFSICVSRERHGTCEGDSGGPLFKEAATGPVELALTSRGPSNECGTTISTRVDDIMPWIEEHIDANWPSSLAPELKLNALPSGPASPEPAFSGTAWPTGAIKLHIYSGSTATGPEVGSAEATSSQGEWATPALTSALAPGEYTAQATESSTYTTSAGVSNAISFTVPSALCSAGSYSATGEEPCTAAPAGTFVSATGALAPTNCTPGSYQPLEGQTSCLVAGLGYYVESEGSASETAAPAGTFVSTTHAVAAKSCPVGDYQPLSGQAACLEAAPGNFVAKTGQASQTACTAGTYQPLAAQASCLQAGVGFYVESSGSASETVCPRGKTTAGTGSTSASQCIAVRLTVASISPNRGPVSGGTLVTITGTGFTAGAVVEIGQGQGPGPTAILARNVDVVSSTEIKAETGGGAKAGTRNMYVISPAGSALRVFTYTH